MGEGGLGAGLADPGFENDQGFAAVYPGCRGQKAAALGQSFDMQGNDPGLGVLLQIFQNLHEPHVRGVAEIHGLSQRAGKGLGPHLGSAALGHQRYRRRIGRADEIHKSGGKTVKGVQHAHGVGANDVGLVLAGGGHQFGLQFFPLLIGVGKSLGNDYQPADAFGKTFLPPPAGPGPGRRQ